jgi:hypothetical protein
VYSFGQGGGGNVNDIPIPGANNVLSIVRYATGIGALMQSFVNNMNLLQVTTLENNASTWTAPITITGPNDFSVCSNNNNVQGGLIVNASSPADYTAVWSCEGASTNVLRAIRFTAGAGTSYDWPVPPVPDGGMPNSFGTGGLAQVGTSTYVLVNPPSNNGPPPAGSSPTMLVANATTFAMPAPSPVPLTNPTDFMLGITLAPTNGGKLGVSALEANLGSTTVYPVIYAGSVATTKVPTLKPSTDLGGATVNSLSELPIVNNGSAHWESFSGSPQSDNLIAVGAIYPNSNGLNFMWLDGTGRLVAERVGSKGLFYFDTSDGGTGPAIYGGDVVFNGAPLPALAGFEILYLQQGLEADGGPGVVIWANQMACVP